MLLKLVACRTIKISDKQTIIVLCWYYNVDLIGHLKGLDYFYSPFTLNEYANQIDFQSLETNYHNQNLSRKKIHVHRKK
ncbi:hypothetical protein DERP_010419 [Dermatophagoides pteronyssinus]|uniref:Uncharacterized protein n=1 Tax=Dermatophagoides pteronyssinus TaxID=6956 RepID=A0ABQ8J4Y6_DERPT|nr:hypothetical protein DERP_010419 [Dermatophagoides pteronyssinus]